MIVPFETSQLLSDERLMHGFGTKQTGDARDEKILKAHIFAATHVQYPIIGLHQAHTDVVHAIDSPHDLNPAHPADGVVTALRGVILTVRTADCVPIIFFDPVAMIIGISHQGWRGTLAKLPRKMVEAMMRLGSSPKDIRCAIGPCIHSCCYECRGARLDEFLKQFSSGVIKNKTPCTEFSMSNENTNSTLETYLDLPCANGETLLSAGIIADYIDVHPDCTCHLSEKYFSYRRTRKHEGQMSHFVGLRI